MESCEGNDVANGWSIWRARGNERTCDEVDERRDSAEYHLDHHANPTTRQCLPELQHVLLITDDNSPLPPDTLFARYHGGKKPFDAVVCMYHDQGQIATKLLGFSEGVTLTGGLKTIYTTPAHGTAYDIVGQNKAHPGAMIKAFEVAVNLANQRRSAAPSPRRSLPRRNCRGPRPRSWPPDPRGWCCRRRRARADRAAPGWVR